MGQLLEVYKQPEVCGNNVKQISDDNVSNFKEIIVKESGEEVYNFISTQVDLTKAKTTLLSGKDQMFHEKTDIEQLRTIIDLQPVNKHQMLNNYLRSINSFLPDAGIYIGCVESYEERKERFLRQFPGIFFRIIWNLDFIINRVIPKAPISKHIHSFVYKGRTNVISLSETLGRLSYCGFNIIDFKKLGEYFHYFSVIKTSEPMEVKKVPCGLLFSMDRVGKLGKIIKVYKFRTMHPYAEYLQCYVLKLNGYNSIGKPANDFRVTSWGKIIRKIWLDEIPQLLNVLKGDMNIVGVRPLSKVSFDLLPEDLKIKRIKYKPGCIPPNVSLCMKGLEGVINAERIYLDQMQHHQFLTPFKFFWMALFNIITHKVSSA